MLPAISGRQSQDDTKTTIDIPTPLLELASEAPRHQNRTVKSLVEEALLKLLDERKVGQKRVFRDASLPGWISPESSGMTVTEMIYEDYAEREDRVVHAADWMLADDDRG